MMRAHTAGHDVTCHIIYSNSMKVPILKFSTNVMSKDCQFALLYYAASEPLHDQPGSQVMRLKDEINVYLM